MAVSVKVVPKFNDDDIKRIVIERVGRIKAAIISRLQFIGETFVKNARERGTYKDRTGNLRSSIGYVILENGQQLFQNFESRAGGKLGIGKAQRFISEVIGFFPVGIVLIAVAGMDYAAAVESRGRDVITASSIQAETDLRNAIKEIKSKAA